MPSPKPNPLKTSVKLTPKSLPFAVSNVPNAAPKIGPVHEKETKTKVKAINKMAIMPFELVAL